RQRGVLIAPYWLATFMPEARLRLMSGQMRRRHVLIDQHGPAQHLAIRVAMHQGPDQQPEPALLGGGKLIRLILTPRHLTPGSLAPGRAGTAPRAAEETGTMT